MDRSRHRLPRAERLRQSAGRVRRYSCGEALMYRDRNATRASLRRCAALLAAGLALAPSAWGQQTASVPEGAKVVPQGSMTLAWHTGISPRWLDPQEHDGTATPDNFLMAI